jgi:hypothetical protein
MNGRFLPFVIAALFDGSGMTVQSSVKFSPVAFLDRTLATCCAVHAAPPPFG